MTNKKLFVGKIPYKATEEELSNLFAQAGTVLSAKIIYERESGRSKGFGFVEMETIEEAQKAMEMFNGYEWGEMALVVNEARPEAERGPAA